MHATRVMIAAVEQGDAVDAFGAEPVRFPMLVCLGATVCGS
jgi:hypothetical protein